MTSSTVAFAVQSVATRVAKSAFLPSSSAFLSHVAQPSSLVMSAGALKDCTSGAALFFDGVRTPAALVVGSALAGLFSMVQKSKTQEKLSRLEVSVLQLYRICSLYAFIMSVTTMVTATIADTALLLGRHDPMATDIYNFLTRELLFEFVLTRCAFLTSIIAFLMAVGGRILLEFDLLKKGRGRFAPFVVLSLGSLITFLISYVNSNLISYSNLGAMMWGVATLAIAWIKTSKSPLAVVSVVCFAGAVLSVVKDIFRAQVELRPVQEDIGEP